MTGEQWKDIKYFNPNEDGIAPHADKMNYALMSKLSKAREKAGIPFKISSGYREGDDKTHGLGKAVDIKAPTGRQRMLIVQSLIAVGFNRIGVYDKHIHVDVGKDAEGYPENVLWSGVSK